MKVTISGSIHDIDDEGKMLGKVEVVVEGDSSEGVGGVLQLDELADAYIIIMNKVTKEEGR